MIYLSLDLEFEQPCGTIISIGYCIGNVVTGEVLHSNDIFIKLGKPLSPFITQLTGITDEILDTQSTTLAEAYEELKTQHTKYNCERNPITWGGGDSEELRRQLGLDQEKFLFGRRWKDTKTLYQAWCESQGMKTQSGLAKSLTRLGLAFKGRKHNSKDDSVNTFLIYCELLKRFKKQGV